MNRENENFITEGLLRYKSATNTYFSFRKTIENELQQILKDRKEWKTITPNLSSIKSTTFGPVYPLLNARIECNHNEQKITLIIAINWYESELETPFYTIWCENYNYLTNKISEQNNNYIISGNQLRFFPDFEKLNIKEDFDLLIDEYLNFILE